MDKAEVTKVMKKLWEWSEQAETERELRLFELAGNLVEAIFTTTPLEEAVTNAILDAMTSDK